MQLKTFQYRLYPKPAQAQQMVQVLNVCRHWYNMCLAERKWSYELEGRRVSKNDQIKQARLYRQTFPQAQTVFSQTLQSVAVDLSKAFDAFFRRVKAGKQPGYPRFKSRNRFHSFTFPQYGSGVKVDGRRLRLYGVGRVAVRWHRPIEGTIKTVKSSTKPAIGMPVLPVKCQTPPACPLRGKWLAWMSVFRRWRPCPAEKRSKPPTTTGQVRRNCAFCSVNWCGPSGGAIIVTRRAAPCSVSMNTLRTNGRTICTS